MGGKEYAVTELAAIEAASACQTQEEMCIRDRLKLWLDLDHSANKGSWNRRIIQSQLRMVSPTVVEGLSLIHI